MIRHARRMADPTGATSTRHWEEILGTLTEDMKRVVEEQRLGFAATVCPDGTPNLSPKGTTAVWDDDRLIFADIRSPRTVENHVAAVLDKLEAPTRADAVGRAREDGLLATGA